MALGNGDKHNFETLKLACKNNDLALVQSTRKADGKKVALVCAVGKDGKEYVFSPVAVMIEGNPYEDFTGVGE